jgi:hypothetical protein
MPVQAEQANSQPEFYSAKQFVIYNKKDILRKSTGIALTK